MKPFMNCIVTGPTKYSVVGELGKGNYARVVKAMRDSKPVALKQQRPACQWEWYIAKELYHRLPPLMVNTVTLVLPITSF